MPNLNNLSLFVQTMNALRTCAPHTQQPSHGKSWASGAKPCLQRWSCRSWSWLQCPTTLPKGKGRKVSRVRSNCPGVPC